MFPFLEVENVKRKLDILEKIVSDALDDIRSLRFIVANLLEDEEDSLPTPEDFPEETHKDAFDLPEALGFMADDRESPI